MCGVGLRWVLCWFCEEYVGGINEERREKCQLERRRRWERGRRKSCGEVGRMRGRGREEK